LLGVGLLPAQDQETEMSIAGCERAMIAWSWLSVMGKSQIKSQSQITNHLTKRFKLFCQITHCISKSSQITLTKSTNQIKSQCQSNVKSPDLVN